MFELHQGDCLKIMADMPDNSVDAVVCDPPYGTTNCRGDDPLPLGQMWACVRRVLKPQGCVVLFGGQPFTSRLVLSNEAWFKHEVIWDKNKCGSPGLAKVRPMIVHENILVFAPGKTTYNPQMEEGEPYSRRSINPQGYVGKANRHGYGMKPRTEFSNPGTRYPKSVLRISRDFSAQQQVHPHQKPVPLTRWLVRTYTNLGDTVLDFSMGSGSTGIACRLEGRRFIGVELDPEYFAIAQARIENEVSGDML